MVIGNILTTMDVSFRKDICVHATRCVNGSTEQNADLGFSPDNASAKKAGKVIILIQRICIAGLRRKLAERGYVKREYTSTEEERRISVTDFGMNEAGVATYSRDGKNISSRSRGRQKNLFIRQ